MKSALSASLLLATGCGGTVDNQVRDAGREAAVSDTGSADTGTIAVDAGPADTGVVPTDLGVADTGPADTGTVVVDSGPMDTGVVAMDTGPADTGPVDTGVLPADAGPPDAGPPDSGPPDTGPSCVAPQTLCGGQCVNTQTDLTHCGTCGTACMGSGQPFTRAACVAGACVVECTTGYIGQPGSCVPLPPPRPIAPLSNVWISSRRPTFRWENPGANDGAAIDFCSDRACATLLATEVFTGESGTPGMDLPANRTVYWRLRGRRGGREGIAAHTSPVWQLHTPVRTTTAAVSTCGFQSRDINGDGYADLAIASDAIPGAIIEYGGPLPLGMNAPTTTLTSLVPGLEGYPARGDFNGDGFGDLALSAHLANNNQGQVMVYLGRATGLSTTAQRSLLDPSPIAGGNFGTMMDSCDVNGDGFDDLLVSRPANSNLSARPVGFYVFHGSAEGIPATHTTSHFLSSDGFGGPRCVGDINGDGFNDVAASGAGTPLAVYHGSPAGLPSSPSRTHNPPAGFTFNHLSAARLGDVNQDGYADFAAGQWTGTAGSFGFDVFLGSSSGAAPSAPLRATRGGDGVLSGAYITNGGTFDGGRTFSVLIPQFRVGAGSLLEFQMRLTPSLVQQTVTRSAPAGTTSYGYSFEVGDLNGDGYCDLGVVSSGSHWVHLYHGSATGAPTTPTQSLTSTRNDNPLL